MGNNRRNDKNPPEPLGNSDQLTLRAVRFTKEELAKTPEGERLFYLLAGQLCNDVNVLRKILLFAMLTAERSADEHPRHIAAVAQTMLMSRLLAGRMHEGWKWISSAQSGAVIRQYQSKLRPQAIAARKDLRKYFGQSNLATELRNNAAFHTSYEYAQAAWESMHDEEMLVDYLGSTRGESIYGSAEVLSAMAMANIVGGAHTGAALNRMGLEIPVISAKLEDYVQDLMRIFLGRHFSHKAAEIRAGTITLADTPNLLDTTIPFFCRPPDKFPDAPPNG